MHPVHPYRKAHPHSRLLTIECILYLGFIVFLFLILGYATNADPGSVLLAFLPALLFGLALIVIIETDHFHPTYNWFVLLGCIILGSVLFLAVPAGRGLDIPTVLILNTVLMALGLVVVHNSYAHEKPITAPSGSHEAQAHHAPAVVHHVHHVEEPKELTDVVHSIEDKVKALNFVIGRVYSVYHGGTDRLRNKIRIDKTWYDDFNLIDEGDIDRRKHEAIVLVQKIRDRLHLLERSERDVFGDDVKQLKNISHSPDGSDRIIAVLVKNDKDPVQRYYDGAVSFCDEALKVLKK